MSLQKILSLLFISSGAVIMLMGIIKYRQTIYVAQVFHEKTKKSYILWYKIHRSLMIFFLFGYLVVLVSVAKNIRFASEFFTSVIFFWGAVFVFLGVLLQAKMLSNMKKRGQSLVEKNIQLTQIQDANIYTLAYLAEIRDSETGKHIERTSLYVMILAQELSKLPQYVSHLDKQYINDIVKSAPLHDIGKVGVPDAILKKEGKLTDEEFEIIKQHCDYGAKILKEAEKKLDFRSYITLAIPLVRSHHERWDGKGYPDGLKSHAIPLSAQIMAVADVYDALRSERCYKKSYDHEKSLEIIKKEKGKQFAPDVVEAFMQVHGQLKDISIKQADV